MSENLNRRWSKVGNATIALLLVAGVWMTMQVNWIYQRHLALDRLNARAEFYSPHYSGCCVWTTTVVFDDGTSFAPNVTDAPIPLNFFGEPGIALVVFDGPHDRKLEANVQSLFPEALVKTRRPRMDLYAPPVAGR